MSIIVTGGCGFIGSNFILHWLSENQETIINIDLLTYSGNIKNLDKEKNNKKLIFIKSDICDKDFIIQVLSKYNPRAIINFAAETHVDRSINNAKNFVKTNIFGVFNLLEAARDYWQGLPKDKKENFRFIHVSTDEVYGELSPKCKPFDEKNRYQPNNPYSASKASSDHLVRSWNKTYNFPTLISNCSNNYGPYQYPEKLIPMCISNAINNKKITIYGDGKQIRDWLYVKDHCDAIKTILNKGKPGETYNVGGSNERSNIEVINLICNFLDKKIPLKQKASYRNLIKYVNDRPGHDKRYSINASKIYKDLGWAAKENFETGLYKTVEWYLQNPSWLKIKK